MKNNSHIKALFVDVGGVLLTNGWDHLARAQAALHFGVEGAGMEARHHQVFNRFEEGRLSLTEYLDQVVFDQKRSFTAIQFRDFMFAQSKPYPDMIELVRELKEDYRLKIVVVSNESRELNGHRIQTFELDTFVDVFISSCFVRLRKPDAGIFRLALDIVQMPAEQVVYIENTPMFVQVAEGMGIHSILHTDCPSTTAALSKLEMRERP